ncbi:hypothetical protein EON83_23665 [bacterium]|nr:MAG: hypothetical protein EON83_23665 [bacterium]
MKKSPLLVGAMLLTALPAVLLSGCGGGNSNIVTPTATPTLPPTATPIPTTTTQPTPAVGTANIAFVAQNGAYFSAQVLIPSAM